MLGCRRVDLFGLWLLLLYRLLLDRLLLDRLLLERFLNGVLCAWYQMRIGCRARLGCLWLGCLRGSTHVLLGRARFDAPGGCWRWLGGKGGEVLHRERVCKVGWCWLLGGRLRRFGCRRSNCRGVCQGLLACAGWGAGSSRGRSKRGVVGLHARLMISDNRGHWCCCM